MSDILRGPDPEPFRTKVHNARWYVDPLPDDGTWPSTDERWPSVTTIKKAWSKPFRKSLPGDGPAVPLDAYWAAEFTVDNIGAIVELKDDKAAAMELIATSGRRTLNKASDRGSGVHTVLEDLAAGKAVDFVEPDVAPFVPGCREFISEWSPEFVASEVIIVNRTQGFAGTADVGLWIYVPGMGRCLVLGDYKSRGGEHGCYEEEIAQIGGYSLGEYMIVQGRKGPERRPMLDFEAGLIVSLTHEGCRLYLVELEAARQTFEAMHTCWHHQRDGQKLARKAHRIIFKAPEATPPASGEGEVEPQTAEAAAPSPSQSRGRASSRSKDPGKGEEAVSPAAEDPPAPAPDPDGVSGFLTEAERTERTERTDQRLDWLRKRVYAVKTSPAAMGLPGDDRPMTPKRRLAGLWSERDEIPTFPKGGPRTDAEIDVIAGMCDLVEMEFELAFGPPDPTAPVPTKATRKKANA